ncbi:MAG: thioredoxin domain-containing protein [Pirellulales bacterium]
MSPSRLRVVLTALGLLLIVVAARPRAAAEQPPAGKPPAGKPPAATPSTAPEKPRHTNRLAGETSPYLLLHAHNPVEWYPWGDEALAKAKREKKPIFLSIGYSSCYWCHVMERESFMDEEIAAALNEHFVCIKVDREERPDIDEIYMHALHIYLQLLGSKQGGGWPLSMFLTPDAKPLMGGTYFPPRDREGLTGFLTIVGRVHEAWAADPEKWQKAGDSLATYVAETLAQQPIVTVPKLAPPLVISALRALAVRYDAEYGGFGFDPENPRQAKFPEPPNLFLLLDQAQRGHESARKMLEFTLERISLGGIRDHVGGGFHRYSTDRFWRVPHFEKMLYDNGQLVSLYARAYALTERADFRRAAEQTIEFVLRELTDAGGGFYAALDAETDGEEGRYYVWERKEVEAALSPTEYALWGETYGITGPPNFEERYIPLLSKPLAESAAAKSISEQQLFEALEPARKKLLAERDKRPRPLTDTKILAGWNGLMIRGLADAGRAFKSDAYQQAGVRAADFVLANMRDDQGRLLRTHSAGQAKLLAYLDDYAFLIDGLIGLHQATGDARWLKAAEELTAQQIELFWDDKAGGFFYTSTAHEQLIARSKLPVDGVTPAGNSLAVTNLLYLAKALEGPEYAERAARCLRSAGPLLEERPGAVPQLAVGLAAWLDTVSKADTAPKADAVPKAGAVPKADVPQPQSE